MTLDLAYDEGQAAIADALAGFCRERCPDAITREAGVPRALWRELAELGVFGLAAPGGEGGALELAAAFEALGAAVFPGPLCAAVFAVQLLSAEAAGPVVDGSAWVSLGTPPLMPWAPVAGIFIELDGERAFVARPRGPVEPAETLGREPWGRVRLERLQELEGADRARTLEGLARAAYLAAAGERLVRAAAEHARVRKQFGRPIGDFQAVAHPLADVSMRVEAAATLARAAACAFDTGATGDMGDGEAGELSAAALLSASAAALEAAHTAFQVFGALGVTVDGPVFHVARRIRQWVSQPPLPAAAAERVLERYGLAAGTGRVGEAKP